VRTTSEIEATSNLSRRNVGDTVVFKLALPLTDLGIVIVLRFETEVQAGLAIDSFVAG
jgi:hypothetical protein